MFSNYFCFPYDVDDAQIYFKLRDDIGRMLQTTGANIIHEFQPPPTDGPTIQFYAIGTGMELFSRRR